MLTNQQIENFAIGLVHDQNAAGVLVLIITPTKRAEIIAALTQSLDEEEGLPALLRRLADEVESGSGNPVGRNGQRV